VNYKEFYGLKNDYMFHAVLQECPPALADLISALMGIPRNETIDCRVENPLVFGSNVNAKDIALDVCVLLNNSTRIDVELQVENQKIWTERTLLYWCRVYDRLKAGEYYDKLIRTYHIGLLNFTLDPEDPEFYSEYRITNLRNGKEYSDKLVLRNLDLTRPELAGESEQERRLHDWVMLFGANTLEEFQSLAKGNEVFEKMAVTLATLNEDEKIRMQCTARQFYEWDLNSHYHEGLKEGQEIGEAIGREEKYRDVISIYRNEMHLSDSEIIEKIKAKYSLDTELAIKLVSDSS